MTSENVESWKVETKSLSIFEAGMSCLLPSWKTPRNRLIVKFRRWKLHLREMNPDGRPGCQTKILYKEEMSRIQGGEDREHWQSFSVRCTHNCCVQVDITLSLTRTVKSRGNQVGIRCLAGWQSAYSVFTLMFMIEIT